MDIYLTAGLLQLYSKGVEDMYLTYNPTITFFKKCFILKRVSKSENLKVQFRAQNAIYEIKCFKKPIF